MAYRLIERTTQDKSRRLGEVDTVYPSDDSSVAIDTELLRWKVPLQRIHDILVFDEVFLAGNGLDIMIE